MQQSARRRSYRTFKKKRYRKHHRSIRLTPLSYRKPVLKRKKTTKKIKLWIKRLADFNAIYSFHESIAVDSTFYHFYRKFYCPKVTYWEQGQKVGFKRCRPKKKNLP